MVIGGVAAGRARRRLADVGAGTRTSDSASLTPAGAAVEEVAGRWLLDLLGLPAGIGGRLRDRRDDGQLHLPGGGARHRPAPGRATTCSPGSSAAARCGCSSGPSGTRRSTCRCGSSGSATLTSYRRTSGGGSAPTRSADALRRTDGPTIVVAPGGQHPLRRLRPVRGVRAARARARRVGARRRRLRAVGRASRRGGRSDVRGARRRRLVGDRRAQDAERALRLRPGDRPRRRRAGVVDGDARRLPDPGDRRPAGADAGAVAPGARRSRPGRRCAASAAPGSSTWSSGWPAMPGPSPTGAARSRACEVLNEVVFTQVCLAFGDDDRTRAVAAALLADGTTWMSGSRWHDRAIVRISVSNWSTTDDDVRRSLDALRRRGCLGLSGRRDPCSTARPGRPGARDNPVATETRRARRLDGAMFPTARAPPKAAPRRQGRGACRRRSRRRPSRRPCTSRR